MATGVRRSKYRPLEDFLSNQRQSTITLSFQEVEAILGFTFPASARKHQAWWANELNGPHPQARAWRNAGFKIRNFNIEGETVVFERS